MIHERLAKGVTLLLLATGATFAACGDDAPLSPKANFCAKQCACNKCANDEQGTCLDDITNLEDEARDKDCKDQFTTYITCLNNDAECTDGDYDISVCGAEETDVNDCLKPPPPACMTANNGVCDEPEGTNTCAEGSDVMDCATSTCPTSNDGTCDEPEGSGLCPEGSDPIDCNPTSCASQGNGVCDEPEGTGLCPEGSDPIDCNPTSCASQGNGVCDEPEGTGLCPEGSDPIDCPPPTSCQYTNDGECDEPEGTGLCAEGSDVNDCASTCLKCAAYINANKMGTLCTASQSTFNAFNSCACGTCAASCNVGSNYCTGAPPTTACSTCVQNSCSSQYGACVSDM
jgi:hypothetical protein